MMMTVGNVVNQQPRTIGKLKNYVQTIHPMIDISALNDSKNGCIMYPVNIVRAWNRSNPIESTVVNYALIPMGKV